PKTFSGFAPNRFFATLRALDQGQWTLIHAERAPGSNALALAINDRLTRAAAKR
ncbi:MAG: translation factor Sua5, partial [Verrucomicrobia bacterium]|nr:translation factor Sua5 [Verrucomicrobiota bacterium]